LVVVPDSFLRTAPSVSGNSLVWTGNLRNELLLSAVGFGEKLAGDFDAESVDIVSADFNFVRLDVTNCQSVPFNSRSRRRRRRWWWRRRGFRSAWTHTPQIPLDGLDVSGHAGVDAYSPGTYIIFRDTEV
jgi:hypothetical protein